MSTPHPLFVPLHAHLFGADELLRAGVPGHQVLSLYPFELGLYRTFFTSFFEHHPEKLKERSELTTSYKLVAEFMEVVEQRVTLGIYTDEQYDRHWTLCYSELSRAMGEIALGITGDALSEFHARLHNQLDFFARIMLLLSDWPAEEFEDDAMLNATTRHLFFLGFERLLAYYDVRIRFDTEQRRIDAQRRLEEAARFTEPEKFAEA